MTAETGAGENGSLLYLDGLLAQGRMPSQAELRQAVAGELVKLSNDYEAKTKTDVIRMAVAAALLEDRVLYSRLIAYDAARDYYFYQKQRSYGISGDDLGPRPAETVSALRIRALADTYLAAMPADVRTNILKKLDVFAQKTGG